MSAACCLSAYEMERQERIARNHKTLVSLGLADTAGWIATPTKEDGVERKVAKRPRGERARGRVDAVRKSTRLPGQRTVALSDGRSDRASAATTAKYTIPPSVCVPWEQAVFQVRICISRCPGNGKGAYWRGKDGCVYTNPRLRSRDRPDREADFSHFATDTFC